ncbi:zinc-binding dehydrogenase [Alicyclobacillus fastidiosus]|uniref:Zinc-binding dehydrogenase n=1 Tax=Alicyclobacillus fastidiosus TaxID=392011 RepID=A0ABY6ZEW1_9BACL|nr:zinc-binding dehydrogenase [Alicyclobacillus fastidiosus]WAH41438.1 zinc-binding dehydrogenase [Alicyclobacillus fastidiosus]GMA63066.1 sorbitol dehydrogenase [Alicyclobacillus fastidiosus]
MKKAAVLGKNRVGLVEASMPESIGDMVVVKVNVAPMCSEYKTFLSGKETDCLGHEAVGEVVQASSLSHVQVGDRVVVMPLNGCGKCGYCLAGDYIHCHSNTMQDATMAQYVLKPAFILQQVPDDISDEMASLACCALGPSFGAFQRMSLGSYDTILVTGLGPVGLGAVVNAKFRGARVIAVDSNQYRANVAREIGAEVVFDPRESDLVEQILNRLGEPGVDYAIDCSGTVAAHRTCIDAVRRKGQVALVGECYNETPIIASKDFIRKGLTLFGSWHYNLNDFPKLMHMIRTFPPVKELISHVYPMTQIQQAFETSASQQCAKILIKPWE